MVMEGYIGHAFRVLRLMYSDGGLCRAFMAFTVLRLMYSDGWLYRAFMAFRVLRLMHGDGWLYRALMAFRVLRLMYRDGWLYRSTGNVCYFSNWYLTFTSNTATLVHLPFRK